MFRPVSLDRKSRWPAREGRRASPRGASLIEIVIATLVLSLVAIGLVEFFAKGRVLFDQEEHKRVATLLAQDALERTVANKYDQIIAWNENRKIASVGYAISVTVQANVPETNLKAIQSTVTWLYRPSVQRSVSLATMVFSQ